MRTDRRRLSIVLAVTAVYCAVELIGGYYANSLALLSDAVHMLTDIAALCLGLLTLWISTRPARGGKTYGYQRAEILGALFNGLFLWVLVIFIWIEAVGRLHNPPAVHGLTVMAIALVGPRARGRRYPDGGGAVAYRSGRTARRPACGQRHGGSARSPRMVPDEPSVCALGACGGWARRRRGPRVVRYVDGARAEVQHSPHDGAARA